ncbi:MAG: subtype II CRISPR-associated endonuclease Cas1 [Bacteroidetes bacterium]|nr:MAG: subtype II CRISPR-associated endonuclease Cas1 [Bacteroidota bacterium]
MLKRTIVIANPGRISFRNHQLVVKSDDKGEKTVPLEDLGVLVIENPQTTITSVALAKLADANVAVMTCDSTHHPVSLSLPLVGHSEMTKRHLVQTNISLPLKKRLWQQCIQAKLGNQARVLELNHKNVPAKKLRKYVLEVNSGDTTNIEARAAQHYWKYFIPDPEFRRRAQGIPPNNLLNYGYAIIRATLARSVVASGLIPSLGLFHRNKYNAFCLADDLMEPYRPFVDIAVLKLLNQGLEPTENLEPEHKRAILEILSSDTYEGEKRSTLWNSSLRTASSLYLCFEGSRRQISFPELH